MTEPSNENGVTRTSEPYRYELSGQEFLDPALGSADGDAYIQSTPASELDPPPISDQITNECSQPTGPLADSENDGTPSAEPYRYEASGQIFLDPAVASGGGYVYFNPERDRATRDSSLEPTTAEYRYDLSGQIVSEISARSAPAPDGERDGTEYRYDWSGLITNEFSPPTTLLPDQECDIPDIVAVRKDQNKT